MNPRLKPDDLPRQVKGMVEASSAFDEAEWKQRIKKWTTELCRLYLAVIDANRSMNEEARAETVVKERAKFEGMCEKDDGMYIIVAITCLSDKALDDLANVLRQRLS